MKYKYRLILRGDNNYTFQYKRKGLFEFIDSWISHHYYDKDMEKVIEYMNEVIKDDNKTHNKKYYSVIKEIENE